MNRVVSLTRLSRRPCSSRLYPSQLVVASSQDTQVSVQLMASQYESVPLNAQGQQRLFRVQSQQNGNFQLLFQHFLRHANDYNVYDRNAPRVPLILLNRSIEQLLSLDPALFLSSPFDLEQTYSTKNDLQKTLLMHKAPQAETMRITYQHSSEEESAMSYELEMGQKDFLRLQHFLRWGMPYVYGWHLLQHESLLAEEKTQ